MAFLTALPRAPLDTLAVRGNGSNGSHPERDRNGLRHFTMAQASQGRH